MSWYKTYKDEWKSIMETVASEENRMPQMVEKDTIQSMLLFELSKCKFPLVFKGGTSLSKVYGLIERFSEDIDLSMSRKLTESEKKKIKAIILSLAEDLGLKLLNLDDIRSKHSYNRYVFEYESLFSENQLELIIETSFYQVVYPVETKKIESFIEKFCKKRDIQLPIPFEASEVEMKVQSLERTFIDKIFAICDYKIQNKQDRASRHLYDIAKIIPQISITTEMIVLIDKVRKDRMQLKNNPSAQLEYSIHDMIKEIINTNFYESDYNNITRKLLYEDITYEDAINKGIAKITSMDIFDYREKRL